MNIFFEISVNFFHQFDYNNFFFFLDNEEFAAMSRKMESDEESNSADESVSSSYETEDSTDNKEDSDSSDSEMETIRRKTSNLNRNILGKKKTIDVDFPYVIFLKFELSPFLQTLFIVKIRFRRLTSKQLDFLLRKS